ncbi:MAG TPA: serine/threonine-protein kinase, partial [Candidatus Acidoferrales bacterium]|nr:serine/threonine-protein kinase [Candidatus Acidoferrales bacterium]
MIGKTLSHYRILEKIGAGSMGQVYRAHDERLERDVAVKVLPPGALSDEARRRFRKEALALSKLNHPNIATVHDFDTQDGVDFLVMELIPGVTLKDQISQAPLAERDVIRLGMQLAQGLAAAHEQGLIHRDLKPSNIGVTPDGRLKILDFGLAKLLQRGGELGVTASGSLPTGPSGTLPYMAPEQVLDEHMDVRADIYSMGVVLYEMATGVHPFREIHGAR